MVFETGGTRRGFFGGLFWMLVAVYVVAEAIAIAGATSYAIADHDVSYLGISACGAPSAAVPAASPEAVCSPLHAVINAGILASGVFQCLGAVLLARALACNAAAATGLTLIGLGGVGAAGAGYFPLDVAPIEHQVTAIVYFMATSLGLCLLGGAFFRRSGIFATLTLFCGVAALTAIGLYAAGVYFELGRGIMERLGTYPMTAWFVGTGWVALRTAVRG